MNESPNAYNILEGSSWAPTSEENTREDITDIYGRAVREMRYTAESTRSDIEFAAKKHARALKGPN